MGDKLWKQWEREIAKILGTRRNPLSGSNNVDDKGAKRYGDVIHDRLHVEVKIRANVGCISLMREEYKKRHGKTFVGIIREKGKKDLIALVVDYKTMEKVLKFIASEEDGSKIKNRR